MFARKVGMYGLLFCLFALIIGIPLDLPLYEVVLRLCKGKEKVASIIVLITIGVLSWALVKLVGPPIVDFLEMITGMHFRR